MKSIALGLAFVVAAGCASRDVPSSLRTSPSGVHEAYVADCTTEACVVIDGHRQSPWERIAWLEFIGDEPVYVAERGGRFHVVYRGHASAGFDAVFKGSIRVDNGHVAYVAEQGAAAAGQSSYVVVDEVRFGPFPGIAQLRLASGHAGWVTGSPGSQSLYVDGKNVTSGEEIADWTFLVDGSTAQVVRDAGAWWVVTKEQREGPFERISTLQADGELPVYAARAADGERVYVGENAGPAYESVDARSLSSASRVTSYLAERGGRTWVRAGRVERGPCRSALAPAISADGSMAAIAYEGQRGWHAEVWRLDRGSMEWSLGPTPLVGDLDVAEDARTAAFLVRGSERFEILRVEDQLVEKSSLRYALPGTLTLSRDGDRWGIVSGAKRPRSVFILTSSGATRPLDFAVLNRELAGLPWLQRVDPRAEEQLLRRRVAAAVEDPTGAPSRIRADQHVR